MTPGELLTTVIEPALALLPPAWDSRAARAMLVTIALQETELRCRVQLISRDGVLVPAGPARGWWQFELGGGLRGVLRHRSTARHVARAADSLGLSGHIPEALHELLGAEDGSGDVLAAVLARCLLVTHPAPLPAEDQAQEGWKQYLWAWRPGKPHPECWPDNWMQGWGTV